MIDDEIKAYALIFIGLLGVTLISPSLEINQFIQPVSELGILNPDGKSSDFPKEVIQGQNINLILFIGNREGTIQYYQVQAKLWEDQRVINSTIPLDATIIESWNYVIADESNVTIPIEIKIVNPGVNQRLIFELFKYDFDSSNFMYNNRRIYLWLNVIPKK